MRADNDDRLRRDRDVTRIAARLDDDDGDDGDDDDDDDASCGMTEDDAAVNRGDGEAMTMCADAQAAEQKPHATTARVDEGASFARAREVMTRMLGLNSEDDTELGGCGVDGVGDADEANASLKIEARDEDNATATTNGDGDEGDEGALTQRDVVERRLKRARELRTLYRDQYWRLLEELRAKHRRFVLKHGHDGSRDAGAAVNDARERAGYARVCAVEECERCPRALTRHCFKHIALDDAQVLYR